MGTRYSEALSLLSSLTTVSLIRKAVRRLAHYYKFLIASSAGTEYKSVNCTIYLYIMRRILSLVLCFCIFRLSLSYELRSPRDAYIANAKSIVAASVISLATHARVVAATTSLAPPTLGVGTLGSLELCPPSPFSGCTSSQDDRPAFFLPPWEYDGSFDNIKGKLVRYVSLLPKCKLVSDTGRYVRFAAVIDEDTVDDLEFYFPSNDSIIQYRSVRRGNVKTDFGANRQRIEGTRFL